ncbi:hypothetical protein SADUNF_Sadunf01G0129800 [Salix dunnii]|uniref:Aconitase A/isopropylmalate dehydratase small subunit swivel domain-containing protein n=1 Tax=Salix dunnii TaxID=1413687 RepID=A0A835NBJ7_9ROSI|nr:hypothetical protein SADUNF_Sadunf01G0129800 [Salix dunnii]
MTLVLIFFYQLRYKKGHDTIILAGAEYGSGSSRDWVVEGPMPLFEETRGLTRHECYILDFLGNVSEIRPSEDVTIVTDIVNLFKCTMLLI